MPGRSFQLRSIAAPGLIALAIAIIGPQPAPSPAPTSADQSTAPTPAQGYTPDPDQIAAWTATAIAQLHLDEAQQAALRAFEAVYYVPTTPPSLTIDQYNAMPMPQRLDYEVATLVDYTAKVRVRAALARKFYAMLTPDQQTQFTGLMDPQHGAHTAAEPAPLPPAEKNPAAPGHTNPSWMVKPSIDDISRVFPSAAAKQHIDGHVMMQCVVDEGGYLTECVVSDETPAGMGFGNAALEISAYMRMNPATNFGVPIRSSVTVPIGFKVPWGGGTGVGDKRALPAG